MKAPCRPLALLSLPAVLAAVLVVAPVAARGKAEGQAGPDAGKRPDAPPAMVYHEAPELAEKAASGAIPVLSKRLPREPLVAQPAGDVARYGGTWRQAVSRASVPRLWTEEFGAREVRLATDLQAVEPELLASLDVSSDSRVFTFHLRAGLRWSDGSPCDAEDYAFAWQDVLLDPELTPAKPAALVGGGRLPRFEKVDPYTVRYTFASPNPLFLRRLAEPRAGLILALPQRYLRQFHPRYAPEDKLAQSVSDGGFQSWVELFAARSKPWTNPELPVLDAWMRAPTAEAGMLPLVRNPYFWQVDPQGNQLPYLDAVEVALCGDREACVRAAEAGEVDFQIVDLEGARSRIERSAAAGVRLLQVTPMGASIHTIFLNRATGDTGRAKLFGDLRFRQALSLGADREAINRVAHAGRAASSQVAPAPGSASYDEATALQYTGHDPEGANALLDEIGLKWDASHERRLGADGAPLSLAVVFPVAWPPGQEEAMALLREQWKTLGITLTATPMGRAEWMDLVRADGWELAAYAANVGGGPYLCISSDGVFPLDGYWFPAPAWGAWLGSGGTAGKEPPPEVKKLFDLYKEYVGGAQGERLREIEGEAFALYVRELLGIGLLNRPDGELFALAGPRLANLPEGPLVDDLGIYRPATFASAE